MIPRKLRPIRLLPDIYGSFSTIIHAANIRIILRIFAENITLFLRKILLSSENQWCKSNGRDNSNGTFWYPLTGTDGIPFYTVFGLKTAYICCGRDWDIRVLLCDIAGHYGTILTFFLKWPYFRSEVGGRRSEVGGRRLELADVLI